MVIDCKRVLHEGDATVNVASTIFRSRLKGRVAIAVLKVGQGRSQVLSFFAIGSVQFSIYSQRRTLGERRRRVCFLV